MSEQTIDAGTWETWVQNAMPETSHVIALRDRVLDSLYPWYVWDRPGQLDRDRELLGDEIVAHF